MTTESHSAENAYTTDATLLDVMGPLDPEITERFEAEMAAIREAERKAWITSQEVWIR